MSWSLVKLRRITRFAYGDSLSDASREDGGVSVYGSNGQVGTHTDSNTLGPTLVIGRKGSFGKVQYCERPVFAIDTTFYVDERLTRSNLRWLFYVLQTMDLDVISEDVGVPGLSREKAYEQITPLPPLRAQRAIANYLDRETAKIDTLTTTKKTMLLLLRERVNSLIANRLTRIVSRSALLRHTARIGSGAGFPHEYQGRDQGDYPFYKVADLADSDDGRTISHAANWIDTGDVVRLGCRLVPAGTILFPKVGAALLGNQRRITMAMAGFDNNLMAITPDAHNPRFLRYFLALVDLGGLANPGPVPSINEDVVGSLRVPVPDLGTQAAVADEIDHMADRTLYLVGKLQRQLALLSERRQALITAAVTGQLDIPDAA